MKKLATAAAIAALLGVSASALAFWGGGPWGGGPGYGNNNMMNDMFGDADSYGDFSMNMGGGGRGWGRGNNRYYDNYGYAPYWGGPYGYGAPYGAPYGYAPYGAPYGAPYAPPAPQAAPAAPTK